jgi:hypothetical protein
VVNFVENPLKLVVKCRNLECFVHLKLCGEFIQIYGKFNQVCGEFSEFYQFSKDFSPISW